MSHGSTRFNVDGQTLSLFEKIESLKEEATDILETTTWPGKSAAVAQEFSETIKNAPDLRNISELAAPSSSDLHDDGQQVIKVLEDVRGRLAGVSSKYGAGKEGVSGSIKEVISWGATRSSKILESCREDVENALTPLYRRLKIDVGAKEENGGPGSRGVLNAAGQIFTAVDIVSGLIPVVGSYVGAAAKVGSAVVAMAQKMDGNKQIAKELEKRISRLSDLIVYFTKLSEQTRPENRKEAEARIDGLKSEITAIQKQVDKWKSRGKLKKAWSATDDGDALNAYEKSVEKSFAEMQILANFNITDLLQQIYTRSLLKDLGDGDYGIRSTSAENATCLFGTRVAILNRIDDWVNDWEKPESSKRVLWIRAIAGCGKSTIARTVVNRWKDRAACAIFHVRRGRDATNKQVLCALARQLAQSPLPEVASAILGSVQGNQDVAHQQFKDQFEKLLTNPLQSLNYPPRPIILVIDALDEFGETKDPLEIVNLIHDQASKLPANIKFLLTSRPEGALISESRRFMKDWQTVDLDLVADAAVEADISLFVKNEFSAIKQKRGQQDKLGNNWPSSGDIVEVVKMSQGIFQWARTAMAYIDEPSPDFQLRSLLKSRPIAGSLDDLYSKILSTAFISPKADSAHRELLSRVLGTLAVTPRLVTLAILAFLYADHMAFYGLQQEQHVRFLRDKILCDLNSLIYIPESPSEPMRLRHTSVRDFLTDKNGSSYGVDVIEDSRRLSDACLRLMGRDLRRNICDFSDLSKSTSANDEMKRIIDLKVSQGLRHCCYVWSVHLTAGRRWKGARATSAMNLPSDLKPFSENNILNWLEIMSLTGATDEAWVIANSVWQWLLECPGELSDSSLITLWDDTQRFIAVFHEPISYGVPHIYASALAHCPVRTKLWEHYGSLTTVHVAKALQMQEWPSSVWKKSTDSPVFSVAFSPDGKRLASGSYDETIRLWNAQTGSPLGEPLKGHSDWVMSVAFSPDGKTLASGSSDQTIRLWDSQTGSALGEPLEGHSKSVRSVAFSPDGKTLASGSYDQTIRLWNAQAGSSLGEPLKGHSGWVRSVAFSPDGKTLASGSDDGTIRLWNAQTGSPLGEPLKGHSGRVLSVAFLPNGKTLASGSDEGTIRLWDAQTGSPLGEPLKGHGNSVRSVACSPDGKTLASGSYDETIRLWNAQAGSPLDGCSNWVGSVTFSPDRKTLASVSYDQTIRLWDAQTRSPLGEPLKGHSGWVTSVAFSPDGKTLASGSYDRTIRLWNAQTGSALGEPLEGHSGRVTSVAFSPDGKTLASVSYDKTIRLWDAQTGSPLDGCSNWVGSVTASPNGKLGTRIHQQSDMQFTYWPQIDLGHQGQWLTLDNDRLLWLPDRYWRGYYIIAKLSKGTVAFASGGFVSCFDVSGALGSPLINV